MVSESVCMFPNQYANDIAVAEGGARVKGYSLL